MYLSGRSTTSQNRALPAVQFSNLIARCYKKKLPISVLFGAINWLLKEWPNHILLIPISRVLATLTASSRSESIWSCEGITEFQMVPISPVFAYIKR